MADLIFRPIKAEHIAFINPQERDVISKNMYMDPSYAGVLAASFGMSAWAGLRCVGAAGVITLYKGRGAAWAILGRDAGPYMRRITTKIRYILDTHPCNRIEMAVLHDFKIGNQWAKMLGFVIEAPLMRKSSIIGADEVLWARVRG